MVGLNAHGLVKYLLCDATNTEKNENLLSSRNFLLLFKVVGLLHTNDDCPIDEHGNRSGSGVYFCPVWSWSWDWQYYIEIFVHNVDSFHFYKFLFILRYVFFTFTLVRGRQYRFPFRHFGPRILNLQIKSSFSTGKLPFWTIFPMWIGEFADKKSVNNEGRLYIIENLHTKRRWYSSGFKNRIETRKI